MLTTLTTLLAGAAALTAANPVGRRADADATATCSSTTFGNFTWQLDFKFHADYIYSTPTHQNSWGYVDFNLTNPAVPYTAVCNARSLRLNDFFYGEVVYNCSAPQGAPKGAGDTLFTFKRTNNELYLNQTWTCYDDPKYPTVVHGYAHTYLPLINCTDETYTNPTWQIGQIYSSRNINCAPVSVPLKPQSIAAVA